MKVVEIEIKEPIWKNRSVGISLRDCNPEDTIKIEIAYCNKGGERLYPLPFTISANEVKKYGVKYKKGNVELYEVPIKDLKRIDEKENEQVNNNNLKTTTMIFDSKEIDKIRKENSERSNFDSRKKLEGGVHIMKLKEIKLDISKKDNQPMIIITLEKSEEYREIMAYYKLNGSGSEIHKSKLVSLFESSFDHVMQPCNDENDVYNQLKKYQGKTLKAAIQLKSVLFEGKQGDTMITTKPELWYTGKASDAAFKMDVAKITAPLSNEDVAKVNKMKELGKEVLTQEQWDAKKKAVKDKDYTPAATPDSIDPEPLQTMVEDDLPF